MKRAFFLYLVIFEGKHEWPSKEMMEKADFALKVYRIVDPENAARIK